VLGVEGGRILDVGEAAPLDLGSEVRVVDASADSGSPAPTIVLDSPVGKLEARGLLPER